MDVWGLVGYGLVCVLCGRLEKEEGVEPGHSWVTELVRTSLYNIHVYHTVMHFVF
jgi:hypothetical protein